MTGRLLKRSILGLLASSFLVGTAMAAELRIGLQEDPDRLDPDLARTFVGRIVFSSLCDKLVEITPELEYVPQLATSWSWSEDGQVLAFELREGVVFHDGEPFDAEAAKFNIERSLNLPGSNRASEIRPVARVEVTGPHRIELHLSAPFAPLIAALSDRAGMMLSPKAAQEADGAGREFAAAPVCSGPFRFVERVAQDRIVLERFADYWDAERIAVDRVVFLPIPDQSVRLANLQSGDLDIIERAPTQDLQTIEADPNLDLVAVTSLGYQGITVNLNNGPRAQNPLGQDPRVREALELAIDRNALNEVAFSGAYVPGNQPVSPENPFYAKSLPIPERDVARAKALLAEAGHERVGFELMIANNPEQQRVGEIVQAMAAEAGFDIRLQAMEFAAALDRQTQGDFEAFLIGWSGRTDPDGNIHIFTETNGALNDGKYSSAEVDELLNAARLESDLEKRKELYAQAMAIFVGQDRPRIYLYHQRWFYGVRDRIDGFVAYPDGLIRPQDITKAG
jgi:peptide/nickel transport system substrate-binding protein